MKRHSVNIEKERISDRKPRVQADVAESRLSWRQDWKVEEIWAGESPPVLSFHPCFLQSYHQGTFLCPIYASSVYVLPFVHPLPRYKNHFLLSWGLLV